MVNRVDTDDLMQNVINEPHICLFDYSAPNDNKNVQDNL